ncbi:CD209 antigen-like protein C [Archocentrus centrarchus]|uniref:CD209 antigen-like protein C n=1 Tax=Archocentrus centrarchus TaxID=63155 RepID=UPI0011EA3B51|nr:CD209 antigen-like protein C [Archocentrus centrarchus]
MSGQLKSMFKKIIPKLSKMKSTINKYNHSEAAQFSFFKNNLTEHLQASINELSFMARERDLLNSSVTELKKELTSSRQREKACPAGWRTFSGSCYFLSNESGSWTRARQDCRGKGADLVIIDVNSEQTFLSKLTKSETWSWIGLTDGCIEGTWKWIDGSSLTLRYWDDKQPDNGGGDPKWGEEDCAHIRSGKNTEENWNDRSCEADLRWICEKMA